MAIGRGRRRRNQVHDARRAAPLAPAVRLDARQHKQHKVAHEHQDAKGRDGLEHREVVARGGRSAEAVVVAVAGGRRVRVRAVAVCVDGVVGGGVGDCGGAEDGYDEREDPEQEVDGDVGARVDGAVDGAAGAEGDEFGDLPDEGGEGLEGGGVSGKCGGFVWGSVRTRVPAMMKPMAS